MKSSGLGPIVSLSPAAGAGVSSSLPLSASGDPSDEELSFRCGFWVVPSGSSLEVRSRAM